LYVLAHPLHVFVRGVLQVGPLSEADANKLALVWDGVITAEAPPLLETSEAKPGKAEARGNQAKDVGSSEAKAGNAKSVASIAAASVKSSYIF
jgi:hypothetical protein